MYTNFQNALLELLKGRKIRNCNWDKHEYIKLENGELRDYNNCLCELNLSEEGSIRYQLTYQWEVLPTVEELLITKGKAYDVSKHCSETFDPMPSDGLGCCDECIVCNICSSKLDTKTETEGGFSLDLDTYFKNETNDLWFRKNMDTINEMWDKLNKEE